MSNALAIASVTETLAQTLGAALPGSGVNGASVTKTRPDATDLPKVGVNVFLYQVSPNAAWRNADLPTRSSDGSLLRRPQAALDLFYLLTFYGDDTALEQQRLLGAVVRQLHAYPALSRQAVSAAISGVAVLAGSDLADQIDVVRFTPVNFSLEELSKLWSVFLKTDYVLSVAYAASVVLIQTDDLPPTGALPVLRPCLQAVPFSLAVINSVQPQTLGLSSPPATAQLTLTGQNLEAADVVAFLTPGISQPIPGVLLSSNPTQGQLVVQLPAGLRPGVNGVTLTRYASLGSPPNSSQRVIAQSNSVAFVVQPMILSLTFSAPQTITVAVFPAVGSSQKVSLVLNQLDASPPGLPLAFELDGLPDATKPDTFDFNTSVTPIGATEPLAVPPGAYLARVRVDTAESPLETGPAGGFTGPIVTVL